MINRPLDERLADWIDRIYRTSGCYSVALYLVDELGGTTLHLIPHVPARYDRPPFPQRIKVNEEFRTSWTKCETVPHDAFTLPFLSDGSWQAFVLHSSGMAHGILVASEPSDIHVLRDTVSRSQNDLVPLWIEYLVSMQSRTMEGILRVTNATASTLSLRQVLVRLVQEASVLFGAKLCSLMLVEEEQKELVLHAAYGCSLEYIDRPNLSLHNSLFGRIAMGDAPRYVEDVRVHPDYRDKELAKSEGLCSLLAVPIKFGEERLGVLGLYTATYREWSAREMELVVSLASSAAVAIRNARLAERNREMEARLWHSSRLATLGELSAVLAHQIRNPLAVVNVLLHSWEQNPPTPEQTKEDIRVIASKIRELNAIVESAVQLARRHPLERQPLDLAVVIGSVLSFLDYRIQEKGVEIHFFKPDGYPKVTADSDRLQHAFLNLLTNALDVLGDRGQIWIVLGSTDKEVSIEFRDNGPGIDPVILNKLGDAFQTTKSDGLGLGISVAMRIIRDHGGELSAGNHPEGGAVFRVTLPMGV